MAINKKKNLPIFIWIKKTYNKDGQEVKNMDKIMFRYKIYEKVEERGDLCCYKLK